MTAFVLVHGSGQNASSWSRVGELLRARGHSVAAPELPKHAADWGLAQHAAQIAAAITAPDTVIVAHSLSGVFLPLVPPLRECALLVFLAAVIPQPGQSVRAQFTEDRSMFNAKWIEAGARWFDASQRASIAREFLFHDCDAETLAWALGTVEPLDSTQLVTQPSPMTKWPSVPSASIVATEDRTLAPEWIRNASRRVLRTAPIEVRAGHCPHMSRPGEIAQVLEQLAARAVA